MYYPVFLRFYTHFTFLLLPRQYFIEQIGKRYHRIFCFLQGVCLRPHFDQKCFGTIVHIIAVSLQINSSGKSRVIFCRL